MPKIYTKQGDKGETGYLGGRVKKSSELINLIGEIDELNASLGVILTISTNEKVNFQLITIQRQLFSIGALVADPENKFKMDYPVEDWISQLEEQIDEYEESLPQLTNFILPGGSPSAAFTHYSRSVCRRVERACVSYLENKKKLLESDQFILKYLNRLSDWLFVLSRYINLESGTQEVIWNS